METRELIIREITEVRHSHIPGWLEFQLLVDWQDKRGVESIPFTYNPDDEAPMTEALKNFIVPTLQPHQILPAIQPTVQ